MCKLTGLMVLLGVLAGCSQNPVQAWDREVLARKEMQVVSDPIQYYYDEHIYFSREASIGGTGSGGGGCGCN